MADQNEKKKGFFASVKEGFSNIGKFFRDTKSEMKKVVWPTKQQTINNTLIVAVVVLIAAILIGIFDMVFGFGLGTLLKFA